MEREVAQAAAALTHAFVARHPDEAAILLDTMATREIVDLLRVLPAERMASLLAGLTPEVAAAVAEQVPQELAQRAIEAMDPSAAAALLARVDEQRRSEVLARLTRRLARELREMMSYPADSAGGLMDPRVLAFHGSTTAERALDRLRLKLERGEVPIHDVFLVDGQGRLTGGVSLQEVAVAPPGALLAELARAESPAVQGVASREEVVETLNARKVASLPVVDFEHRLIGVIRQAALVTAAEEEISADLVRMVGASAQERALSSVWLGVRKRLPWLNVNLATAFLAAAVVGLFEPTIARFTALAVLLPVVAGQSGNTGSQALAVTMRGLALREIHIRHWLRVARKELALAFVNGCAIAAVTSLAVYLWSGSPGLAIVIGLAMVISMLFAGLSGAAIPMLLAALGQDPAQASSIILTTVTDVMGFLSFLGLATVAAGLL